MEDIIVVYMYTDQCKLDIENKKYDQLTKNYSPVFTIVVYKKISLQHIKRYIVNTLNLWSEIYYNKYLTSDDMGILAHKFIVGLLSVTDPGLVQILHKDSKVVKTSVRTEVYIHIDSNYFDRVCIYNIDPWWNNAADTTEIKYLGDHSWGTIDIDSFS